MSFGLKLTPQIVKKLIFLQAKVIEEFGNLIMQSFIYDSYAHAVKECQLQRRAFCTSTAFITLYFHLAHGLSQSGWAEPDVRGRAPPNHGPTNHTRGRLPGIGVVWPARLVFES